MRCGRRGSATRRCSSPRTCASAGPRTRSSTTSTCRCSRRSGRPPAARDRDARERQPARRDARLQRRHAARAQITGSPRTGSTSSATRCERAFGGVAIEMAGSVGSVESPEVYPGPISRMPQQFIDASHPAGCRTLFQRRRAATDAAGKLHVPLGYDGETKAFGDDDGEAGGRRRCARAPGTGRARTGSGARRANICVPLHERAVRARSEARRVRAAARLQRRLHGREPGARERRHDRDLRCNPRSPRSGSATASSSRCRARCSRSRSSAASSGRRTCRPRPSRCRRGRCRTCTRRSASSTGSPRTCSATSSRRATPSGSRPLPNLNPSCDRPLRLRPLRRLGVDLGPEPANIIGTALVRLLDAHGGAPERIVEGRYVLPGGTLSRDPLGGPEIKCNVDQTFGTAVAAVAVELAARSARACRSRGCRSAACRSASRTATRAATSTPAASACGSTCSRRVAVSIPGPRSTLSGVVAREFYTSPPTPTGGVVDSRQLRGFFLRPSHQKQVTYSNAQGRHSHPGRAGQSQGRARAPLDDAPPRGRRADQGGARVRRHLRERRVRRRQERAGDARGADRAARGQAALGDGDRRSPTSAPTSSASARSSTSRTRAASRRSTRSSARPRRARRR